MSCLRQGGHLMILGLLLLGSLACATSRASRRAGLVARRETEFADLSQQAGMVTPSYLQASTAQGHDLPVASAVLREVGEDTPSW